MGIPEADTEFKKKAVSCWGSGASLLEIIFNIEVLKKRFFGILRPSQRAQYFFKIPLNATKIAT